MRKKGNSCLGNGGCIFGTPSTGIFLSRTPGKGKIENNEGGKKSRHITVKSLEKGKTGGVYAARKRPEGFVVLLVEREATEKKESV